MNILKSLCEKCGNDLCYNEKCKTYYEIKNYLNDNENILNDRQKQYLLSIYTNTIELFISEFYQVMKLSKANDKLLNRLKIFSDLKYDNPLYLAISEELLKYLC